MSYKVIDESTGEIEIAGNKFEASRTGLTINGEPTYEEWELYGNRLEFVEGAIQWLIGDWLNYGEFAYGEMYSQAVDETQVGTWQNYKYVCNKIESSRRRELLSFAHHQEVAPFEPEEQDELLDLAIKHEWNRAKLRKKCRKRRALKAPTLPEGKYRVIYADPPWEYGDFGVSVSSYYGGSERHYPVMSIEELEALPVKNMAGDNSVLFMWVTSPKLNQVWGIIEAWGYEYKTSFVWDKIEHNFGYYNSVRHEMLLVCGRGSSAPNTDKLHDSVQSIKRSDTHSKKPYEFRKIIEELYPNDKKIELFSRTEIDGWDRWGEDRDGWDRWGKENE